MTSGRQAALFDGRPKMRRHNCAARRWRWFEQKRLGWSEGYRILLRIETRFWERRERISEVKAILARCPRAALIEMGYRVE